MRLGLGAQLLVHQMIIFVVGFKFFSTTLHTWLSFLHSLTIGLSQCICDYPLDLMGIHLFFCCAYGGERMISHDVAWMHLCLSQRMPNFISYMNIPTFFCCLPFILCVDIVILVDGV